MPPRKRVRKRKRRNVSSSSSSSSSSASSSDDDEQVAKTVQPPLSASAQKAPADPDTSSDSDTESSASSSSNVSKAFSAPVPANRPPQEKRVPSRSPSPVDVSIPPMFPPSSVDGPSEKEKALKEKFRKFWMSSVADAFKDELEEIRKEPNLTTSKLSLLIDALASGADVYASNDDPSVNEMEMVLGDSEFKES